MMFECFGHNCWCNLRNIAISVTLPPSTKIYFSKNLPNLATFKKTLLKTDEIHRLTLLTSNSSYVAFALSHKHTRKTKRSRFLVITATRLSKQCSILKETTRVFLCCFHQQNT